MGGWLVGSCSLIGLNRSHCGPLHLLGVPPDRTILEVAVVGEHRGSAGAQPEYRILDHRLPRANRIEEHSEVLVRVAVAGGRCVHFIVALAQLLGFGILAAVVGEKRLLHRPRERVGRVAGLLRSLPAR